MEPALAASSERNPVVSDFFVKLGTGAAGTGDTEAAAGYFEQAIRFDRTNATAWISLAEAQRKLGRVEAALASYQEARALAERQSAPPAIRTRLLSLHSLALLDQGRHVEAIPGLEDAVEMGNREWTVLRGLLDAYWQGGHYRKAMAMIGFNPNLAGRVIEHLFAVEGQCECCGRCCRKLFLVWNGEPIHSQAALEDRWRNDPRTRRLQPIRVVNRQAFQGFPLPSETIWEALLAEGYIDAAGATQVSWIQAESLELPGLPLSPLERDRVRDAVQASPVLTSTGGEYLFHCRLLGGDNRCGDHEHRLPLCREFPTARTILLPNCGYHLRLQDTIRHVEAPSLFRLAGWYAVEHGMHQEFLPYALDFLEKHSDHRNQESIAGIHTLVARCCRLAGDEHAAAIHEARAAVLTVVPRGIH